MHVDLQLIARIKNVHQQTNWGSGCIEIFGKCSLTGRDVVRYISPEFKVFEWNDRNDCWVPLPEGVCAARSSRSYYSNNVYSMK